MSLFKRVACVSAMLTCGGALALWADTKPNPYLSIAERNPFVLKPQPVEPPVEPPAPPAPPMAKVVLTGVTSIFGPPRALLEITEQEPGKQPNVNKRILREGERDGSIEVLSIDVVHTSVRIKNGTVETNVVFEVAKSSPTPAGPTAGPLPPPISSPSIPPPAAAPSFTSAPPPPAAATPLNIGGDNRGERANTGVSFAGGADLSPTGGGVRGPIGTPYAQSGVNVNPFAGMNNYGSASSLSTSRPLRADNGSSTANTGAGRLSSVEADAAFEKQRYYYQQVKQAGGHDGPPMPPTRFTAELFGQPGVK